ncbi:Thiamin ABC transporter, substrate-binding component [hydrothermal vent metagenome]|uniref:Thiamin ABC transporter, substrate-binding component n=1 Tax=hydrothermal vent metagenome TaxID=652676 RepID=A0A3B0R910_9ZZZZ
MRFIFTLFALLVLATNPAAAKPTLTIYTYESFTADWGPGPVIKKSFEKTCDCTLNWVAIADGVALLNRLKLEGTATRADIVLGLDTNLVIEAKKTGLFEETGVTPPSSKISNQWQDNTFIAYDYAPFAVIWDRQKMKNPPTSLKELVEGPTDQKIILQDPRTSTPGLGFLVWMKAVYGDQAEQAWQKLSKRILTITPGWSEAYGLFTKGEAPMVLSYVTSPAYHMIAEKTNRYQATKFAEGHYLQIEVAGLIKTSKNKELAREFLTFMVSPAFQDHIPTKNWMFPAGKTSKPLPKEFGRLISPDKLLWLDPKTIAENRKAWIAEWLKAMSK